jgi:uncharacterized protein related to proFAR isomerase
MGRVKTTFAREFLPQEAHCKVFVNADLIAAGLAPFAPETAAFQAGRLMIEQLEQSFQKRHSFAFMLAKRIIPCLDVTGGRVVKGVNFVELRDAGDPVEIAARYNEQGADELTFLDITATSDGRDLILHIIEAVASQVFIPLTVGGGVRTVEDVRRCSTPGPTRPVSTRRPSPTRK